MEYLAKLKNTFIHPENLSLTDIASTLDVEDGVGPAAPDKVTSDVGPITCEQKCLVGDDVYSDVEFFRCFTESAKGNITVFDKINHCHMSGSKALLKVLLGTPIYDTSLLLKRQQLLQNLEEPATALPDMAKLEKDVLWVFDEVDQTMKDLYDMVYFKFCICKPLNRYPHALTIHNIYRILGSPIIGVMSPILYVVVPYMIIVWKLKLKIPFKMYVRVMLSTLTSGEMFMAGTGTSYSMLRVVSCVFSIIFYFQGIFNSFELSKTLYKISKHLVDKVNNIVSFLKHAVDIVKAHWKNDMQEAFVTTKDILPTEKELEYVNELQVLPFSLKSNFGQQLHTYMTLDKSIVKSLLLKCYMLESMWSITQFKNNYGVCYAEYIEDAFPRADFQECFHPCLALDRVVKNDICLGNSPANNAILTGPNAGGKSTFVKSLIVNALLAQTIGVCVASRAQLTPFAVINSQINIPDCKGYESLFEAEMYRCKYKLDLLKQHEDKRCLFVMDEIFNSTNPVEGIAGAYAIAKKMAEHPNCILVFTTHYVYLTKLHKTGRFINLKMNVERGEGDIISYPYKLMKGVSKQYIALDLLKKNGFDESIIQEAIDIKERLTHRV